MIEKMKTWFNKYKIEIEFWVSLILLLTWLVGSITLCIIGGLYSAPKQRHIGIPCFTVGFCMLFIPFIFFIFLKVMGYETEY